MTFMTSSVNTILEQYFRQTSEKYLISKYIIQYFQVLRCYLMALKL